MITISILVRGYKLNGPILMPTKEEGLLLEMFSVITVMAMDISKEIVQRKMAMVEEIIETEEEDQIEETSPEDMMIEIGIDIETEEIETLIEETGTETEGIEIMIEEIGIETEETMTEIEDLTTETEETMIEIEEMTIETEGMTTETVETIEEIKETKREKMIETT